MNTYVLLNEYIPEIKFKGKLLNSDVVTAGETVTFDASDSNFCSDYAGIIHGFYNFPKNHAEGVTGYPKYFFDYRDNENKVCSVHAVDPDPSNVSYVTLSGYDPLASDEDNLPYVALRVANGDFMLPNDTEPVDCIYPSEIVFDFKVESFGDQDIPSICAMADFFCTQRMSDDTYANTMMVAKRDNGKTVITTDSYLPATGDYISGSSMVSTQELDIDWSQWHRIRITYDYTKAFVNAHGETVQGHNCTYFRLYIDDVFIPFIYTGLPGEWCDNNWVLEDGSIYPSGANSVPYFLYCGFASYVSHNCENSAVLYKNFRINRYAGQNTTLNADWYKWRPYGSPHWLYLDTGLTINHKIEASSSYPNAETNAYRITVYNQWGSSNTIDYTEQCIVPPTVGMNYVLQSTGIPVTVTTDTQVELSSTDIVTLNAVTTSGMTHVNAETFYPWENDATTHSGYIFSSLGQLDNPNYQSMIDYSDGWLQLNRYTGRGPDARFGSNYYDFETLEGFFKITTEDVNAMLQETGADNSFYIPLIMFGIFTQYSNHRCYVCYNPKINLDDDKSIATFGKKTEGTFSICRFDGFSGFEQCYFTFPKLEDTDIYHIALCYRVNNKRMCFVFINGICVFSAKFDDKVLDDYSHQKAVLGTNSSAVDWIPVTLAMRSIRESLVKVYDVNFDMKGCFTFEDYPNGYAVDDGYYAYVGDQLADRKYFDPAVLYPDNKLTYQVLNPGVNNSWWLTLPDEEEQKISDNDTAVVTVNRNCIYTLKSQDSAGGEVVNLNLDFILHVPPTAVITTDSLSVYKGQYVVLSGENSFDEITSYQWSDGSTGSQTGFFAEQDTTVSLIVTNPYGSDTAVVTIKVVELPVIEDVAGEYRIITVQQIPVDPVPYQEFAVILNGQNCFITLRQMGDFIYMSLRVDNTVIYNNLICDVNRVINIYPDANFSGKFFFVDTKGKVKPEYSGLNSRWLLYYSEDY